MGSPNSKFRSFASEVILERQLDLAIVEPGARNTTKGGCSKRSDRIGKYWCVRGVESFCAKLKPMRFTEWHLKGLAQRQIDDVGAGSNERISGGIPVLQDASRKPSRVEPACGPVVGQG